MQNRLSNIEEKIIERGNNHSYNYFVARDNLGYEISDSSRL